MHLWEIDHPYYCNDWNLYTNESCESRYKTWKDFFDEQGQDDMDLNLVFRFDWVEGEEDDAQKFNGDIYYRNGELKLFYMNQRKGVYRWAIVEVCRADEPAVIEFLKPRWEHMKKLWEPLA